MTNSDADTFLTMNRITAATAAALLIAVLTQPALATAASNSATTSIPVDPATQIEMHVTANCMADRCSFNTTANLLTPDGPTGFPGDTWARQTITVRSSDRNVWQEAGYSAPSGTPRADKGANHDNVLSKMYKSLSDVEISVTTFGVDRSNAFRSTATRFPPIGAPASRTPAPPSSRAPKSRWSTAE